MGTTKHRLDAGRKEGSRFFCFETNHAGLVIGLFLVNTRSVAFFTFLLLGLVGGLGVLDFVGKKGSLGPWLMA